MGALGSPATMADANRRGDGVILIQETQDAIAAATRANVNLYAVDPRGLTSLGDEAMALRGVAGQRRRRSTSASPRSRKRRASRRTACACSPTKPAGSPRSTATTSRRRSSASSTRTRSYYVLGYYSSNERRDGRFRKIEVRLGQPGLTVRARKGYVAPRGGKAATERKVDPSAGTSTALRDALNSPLQANGAEARRSSRRRSRGRPRRPPSPSSRRWSAATSRSPRRTASTPTRSRCRISPSTRTARWRPATGIA